MAIESKFGDDIGYQKGVWECPDPLNYRSKVQMKKVDTNCHVGDNPNYNVGSKTHYLQAILMGRHLHLTMKISAG